MKPFEKNILREYIESALIAVLIALLVRNFVMAAYKIPTGSMIPTLKIGDSIFSWKIPYGLRVPFTSILIFHPMTPRHGDVMVFKSPEDKSTSVIKRVVALPGDRVEIKKRILYINGKAAKYTQLDPTKMEEVKLKDYYTFFEEESMGHKHQVMFRNGQEEDKFGPEVVPDGKLFVLGDNRDSSEDSRYWGMVPIDSLEGRAFMIWLSLDWTKRNESSGFPELRRDRVFKSIQ